MNAPTDEELQASLILVRSVVKLKKAKDEGRGESFTREEVSALVDTLVLMKDVAKESESK